MNYTTDPDYFDPDEIAAANNVALELRQTLADAYGDENSYAYPDGPAVTVELTPDAARKLNELICNRWSDPNV
jgi:hypothetical protein